MQHWARRALGCGFHLVPAPVQPLSIHCGYDSLASKKNPLNKPNFIPLNIECLLMPGKKHIFEGDFQLLISILLNWFLHILNLNLVPFYFCPLLDIDCCNDMFSHFSEGFLCLVCTCMLWYLTVSSCRFWCINMEPKSYFVPGSHSFQVSKMKPLVRS